MLQVVSVVLDATERDAAESVDFEYELLPRGVCDHVDIGFFANADAVPCAIENFTFEVSVECEIVETAVGETVAIIWEDNIRI